jgi:HK97 gp10 family phage protein
MVEIKGMKELKKAFDDLEKLAEKNQKTALKLTAQEYANDVKAGAPYDTGTLRRSIHVQMVDFKSALVGTDLPYARRLEYGFADKDKLGRVYNQSARPYFRPPLDQNWQKYQKTYLEALGRA